MTRHTAPRQADISEQTSNVQAQERGHDVASGDAATGGPGGKSTLLTKAAALSGIAATVIGLAAWLWPFTPDDGDEPTPTGSAGRTESSSAGVVVKIQSPTGAAVRSYYGPSKDNPTPQRLSDRETITIMCQEPYGQSVKVAYPAPGEPDESTVWYRLSNRRYIPGSWAEDQAGTGTASAIPTC